MLYFVKADGELLWTENIGQEILDIASATGKDLAVFTDWWRQSDRSATVDDVRVALRYGVAATGGIVVDARHVVTARRPAELRKLAHENAEHRDSPGVLQMEAYLEQLAPGWRDEGARLDGEVAAALERSISESEEEARQEFATPVNTELSLHWKRLGGSFPALDE